MQLLIPGRSGLELTRLTAVRKNRSEYSLWHGMHTLTAVKSDIYDCLVIIMIMIIIINIVIIIIIVVVVPSNSDQAIPIPKQRKMLEKKVKATVPSPTFVSSRAPIVANFVNHPPVSPCQLLKLSDAWVMALRSLSSAYTIGEHGYSVPRFIYN